MLSSKWIPYLIVAIIFAYNPPWPIFGFSSQVGMVLSLLLVFFTQKKTIMPLYARHYWAIALLFTFFIVFHIFSGLSFSYIIYICVFYYCYKYLDETVAAKALRWTTNILSIVLGVSLLAWLVHNNLYRLPIAGYIDLTEGKGAETIMSNYIFFVQNENAIDFVNRFYSIFDEPGVVGTLSAFILFANRFDFKNKKQLIVILLAGFFTYSLAFYVMVIMGYVYTIIKNRMLNFSTVAFLLVASFIFIFFISKTQEFEYVLKYRFEQGVESSLEDRTEEHISNFYERVIGSFDWFLGYGKSGLKKNGIISGSSYKIFILREGFIAILSLLFAYFVLIRKRNFDTIAFFLLYWASFLQRANVMTAGFIMMFAVCVMYMGLNNSNIKDNEKTRLLE